MSDVLKENLEKDTKKHRRLEQVPVNKKLNDYRIKNRYSWLLIGTVISIIVVTSFVIIFNVVTGNSFNLDVATVLSTLLAFFSIFLSSFFYFKATEQSNQFYDRSYSHTRDIANLLASMEGRFGEALRNIENHNTKMNDRFDKIPLSMVDMKNDEINDVLVEKEKILQELLDKTNIEEGAREEYKNRLEYLEGHNFELKRQLEKLILKNNNIPNTKFDREKLKNQMNNPNVHPGYLHEVLYELGPNRIYYASDTEVAKIFNEYSTLYMPDEMKKALSHLGLVDNNGKITRNGIQNLKTLSRDFIG